MTPGLPLLTGTDGVGFNGRLVLGLQWAADKVGMLSHVNVQLSSAGGILVPVQSASLPSIMNVVAQAQEFVRRWSEMRQGRSTRLTEKVVQSLHPTDGIAEAAALAGSNVARCAFFNAFVEANLQWNCHTIPEILTNLQRCVCLLTLQFPSVYSCTLRTASALTACLRGIFSNSLYAAHVACCSRTKVE
jgi:hypothetical protein